MHIVFSSVMLSCFSFSKKKKKLRSLLRGCMLFSTRAFLIENRKNKKATTSLFVPAFASLTMSKYQVQQFKVNVHLKLISACCLVDGRSKVRTGKTSKNMETKHSKGTGKGLSRIVLQKKRQRAESLPRNLVNWNASSPQCSK